MTQIITLNPSAHRDWRIDATGVEALGAAERMVPVVLSEFQKLIVHYPLLLTKHAETGKFLSVALLGFEPGENLFWNDSRWNGVYVPLNITRQPFFLGEDGEQALLCVDADSPCVMPSGSDGEALFDAAGKETEYLERTKGLLAALAQDEKRTAQFIDVLSSYDLLVPLSLEVSFANGQSSTVKGLYTVDENRLSQLPQDKREHLFQQDYLKPIYIMIASLSQIYALIERKNERLSAHG